MKLTQTPSHRARPGYCEGEVLRLFPGGYPVHIDLAVNDVGGVASGMRFLLPLNGLNLPLTHQFEHKLIIALRGQLQVRRGRHLIATLHEGTGVVVSPGTAHRIAQHGEAESVVGVVLWPGSVEQAFRAIAEQVATVGADRAAMKAILADYGVVWDQATATPSRGAVLKPQPAAQALSALPAPVFNAVDNHLKHWLG